MLHRLRRRAEDQRGFTLIELLVVILIIGILAAIALPTFLGQRVKGQDASAKSDARNTVSQVESCYADTQDYQQCDTAADLGTTGLDIGGAITITSNDADSYAIAATSESTNVFTITKVNGGPAGRTCTVNASDDGGCNGGTW